MSELPLYSTNQASGFRVSDFGIYTSGYSVLGMWSFGFRVSGFKWSGLRVSRCENYGIVVRISSVELRVSGLEFRAWGFEFRVKSLGFGFRSGEFMASGRNVESRIQCTGSDTCSLPFGGFRDCNLLLWGVC